MLGLIARADNSGLGVQTWELYRHLQPAKTLVIDVSHLHDQSEHCNKATHLDRFPGAMVHQGWKPGAGTIDAFLDGLDTVLTCETPYNPALFTQARNRGIRTVLQYNYEFLDTNQPHPDVYAAPSLWRFDDAPPNKVHLPVPIATDRFTPRTRDHATDFVHIVGRPAIHDRNGTNDLLAALKFVNSNITVTIKTQDQQFSPSLAGIPDNVTVRIDRTDVRDYWDNYLTGDVLVMPRRFGGLCLPVNEALGAGMPVIMPDVSPNNLWLPTEWLVESGWCAAFQAKQRIDIYSANHKALAAKIDQFTSPGFYTAAKAKAVDLAKRLSWDELLPEYQRVLS